MDESAFQRELIQLKYRINQLSLTYQRPARQPLSISCDRDAFCEQLDKVKSQLNSIQASLNHLTNTKEQSVTTHIQRLPVELESSYSANPILPQQNSFMLPPISWQLFTSLRADIRGIDGRVGNLEQRVSAVEDRFDSFDSVSFTPPSSEGSAFTATGAPDVAAGAFGCTADRIDRRPARYAGFGDDMFCYEQSAQTMASTVSNSNIAIRDSKRPTATFSSALEYSNSLVMPGLEGIAFRDKEIARLEELLRDLQEKLTHSETLLALKESEAQSRIREQIDRVSELERVSAERGNAIKMFRALVEEKHDEIETLQNGCQSKDAAVNAYAAKVYDMQASFLRVENGHCYAEGQVQLLQSALHDLQGSKQEADEMAARDGLEIRRLREFLEAKERIACQQEEVIARGAKILEQRDSELERANRRIKVLEDDFSHQVRKSARFARLLHERDQEQEWPKSSLDRTVPAASSLFKPGTQLTKSEIDVKILGNKKSPASTSRNEPLKGEQVPRSRQWKPQVIVDDNQMQHGLERGPSWEQVSASNPWHRSGHSAALGRSPQQQTSRPLESQQHDLRRSKSLKLLRNFALAESGPFESLQQKAEVDNQSRRQKPPLREIAAHPQSPALLPPRNRVIDTMLESFSNRSTTGSRGHPAVSRHYSIQELPRRNLQAYVEEEDRDA